MPQNNVLPSKVNVLVFFKDIFKDEFNLISFLKFYYKEHGSCISGHYHVDPAQPAVHKVIWNIIFSIKKDSPKTIYIQPE